MRFTFALIPDESDRLLTAERTLDEFWQRTQFPALDSAWQFSDHVNKTLESAFGRPIAHASAVAICGSVKRMEAHAGSDLDLLVVVDDRDIELSADELQCLQNTVWQVVAEHDFLKQFEAPKPGGLFSICASWRKLVDPEQRGIVDADITTFGHRMHVLMDAVPVAGAHTFERLQKDILEWYSEHRITSCFGGNSPFDWLKQDILRYWHSIHARAYWIFHNQAKKSATVNLKLRSSRLLQIVAFLVRLQEVERLPENQRLEALLHSGTRSPLETIIPRLSEEQAAELLTAWEQIWLALERGVSDPKDVAPLIPQLRTLQDQIQHVGFRLL